MCAYWTTYLNQAKPREVFSVDEVKLAEALDGLTLAELDAAYNALGAYKEHREAATKAPPGTQSAPFNWGKFAKDFITVFKAVWPVLGPMIGL